MELVGVDDCMPAICWRRYFMEAQGFGISAILLEKNGKASSSRHIKHMNIRYYFGTDQIKKHTVKCKMLA
jgi:hypothetical protein